ncbi:MAG: hypothetical protein AAF431_19045 [Pseudomonadota bacterium]
MQLLRRCDVDEVRARWLQQAPRDVNHIDRMINPAVRRDFPYAVTWCLALIESSDIESIFLISIDDFGPASDQSWRLEQAAARLSQQPLPDDQHARKVGALSRAGFEDFSPVLVSTSLNGPFTIIDGNHRMIVRQQQGQVPGTECCLALHEGFAKYTYATQANNWQRQNR